MLKPLAGNRHRRANSHRGKASWMRCLKALGERIIARNPDSQTAEYTSASPS